jgi:fucose permease
MNPTTDVTPTEQFITTMRDRMSTLTRTLSTWIQAQERPQQRSTGWILAILLLIYIGTEVGFNGWLTVYLISGSSLAPASAALIVSGFWLALTLGRARRGVGAALNRCTVADN